MSEDTSPLESPTRRAFMSGIALTATAVVGSLYLGGTRSRDARTDRGGSSSDGGDGSGAPSTTETTPTPTTTPAAGSAESTPENGSEDHDHESGSDDHADTPLAAFRHGLDDRFVAVDSLSESDGRVSVAYVSDVERAHEVAARIETVVVTFVQAYERADDWSVEGLDAERVTDAGRTVGYWRLEARWVDQLLAGTITRTELLERTLDTYHGRLGRGHDHESGEDGQDHETNEDGHHHEPDEGGQHHESDGVAHHETADDH